MDEFHCASYLVANYSIFIRFYPRNTTVGNVCVWYPLNYDSSMHNFICVIMAT